MELNNNFSYEEAESLTVNYYNLDKLYSLHKTFRDDFFLFVELKNNSYFIHKILKKYFPIIRKIDRIFYRLIDKIKSIDEFNSFYQLNINLLIKLIEQNNNRFLFNYALINDSELKMNQNIFINDSVNNNVVSESVFIAQNELTNSYYIVNDEIDSAYTIIDINIIDNGIYTIFLKE